MEKIKYSIIIPVKNHLDLLQRALDSIPARPDIEIVIVDDGSIDIDPDNYPGQNRAKIIYSKEGKGAGHARNLGLAEASGKWLVFMDADDFLTENADALLERYADNDEYDIVYFDVTSVMSDDLSYSSRHEFKSSKLKSLSGKKKEMDFFCRYRYTEPWGKFIRREMILSNNILFEESIVANDFFFSVKSGYYAKTIIFDSTVFYCVTQRKGSLSDNMYFDSDERLAARVKVYANVDCFARSHHIDIHPLKELAWSMFNIAPERYDIIIKTTNCGNSLKFYCIVRKMILPFRRFIRYVLGRSDKL